MEPKHSCKVDDDLDYKCKITEDRLKNKVKHDKKKADSKYNDSDDDSENDEEKLNHEVEQEWNAKLKEKYEGSIAISKDPISRKKCKGITINYMNMLCGETGKVLWKSKEWTADMYKSEQEAHIPAEILSCQSVSREINFTSTEQIDNFRLEQRVFLNGVCIEEWLFTFGFVIPGSTNTWQQTIESAGKGNMLSSDEISGKLTIETGFYDDSIFISKTVVRIFYI